MTYRNIIKFNLLSLSLIFITSCSEPVTSPEKIANDFYLNLLTGNVDSAFMMFSDESKEGVTVFDFKEYYTIDIGGEYPITLNEFEENPIGMLSIGYPVIEIKNIALTNKSASIDLSAQINDILAIAQKLMSKITEDWLDGLRIDSSLDLSSYAEEMIAEEINKTDNSALPKKNLKVLKINLVLEKDGWKIDEPLKVRLNAEKLRQQKIKKEEEDAIKKLEEEAERERLEKIRLEEEKIKKEQQLKKEKSEYMENKVSIFDFDATRIDTYSDKNIPAVRFAIKNIGNRSLDEVKVTVIFYDWDNLPIYEKSYYPVLVTKYSTGDTPLKPNYIERQKEGRYYTIEELGPEWSGKATISVSDIEFSSED